MDQEKDYIQNKDGTITIQGKTGLPMYVIYDHPRDFPKHFVVRPHLVGIGGAPPFASPNGFLFNNLSEARKFIPMTMVRIDRDPKDDPVITEIYI